MPVPTMAPTPSAIRCGQLSVLAKDWLASCDRMSSSDLRGPNIRFSPFVAGSGRDFELCFQIVERRLDMLGQQMLDGIAIARHPRVEQLPVFEVRPRFAARRDRKSTRLNSSH